MPFVCLICRESLEEEEEKSALKKPSKLLETKGAKQYKKIKSHKSDAKNKTLVATRCGHLFHYKCLHSWLSKFSLLSSCPSCNQQIQSHELIQLFPAQLAQEDYEEKDYPNNSPSLLSISQSQSQYNKDIHSSSSAFSPKSGTCIQIIQKEIQNTISLLEFLYKDLQLEQKDSNGEQLAKKALNVQLGALKSLHLGLNGNSMVFSQNNSSEISEGEQLMATHMNCKLKMKSDEIKRHPHCPLLANTSVEKSSSECSCLCTEEDEDDDYTAGSGSDCTTDSMSTGQEGDKDAQGGFMKFLSNFMKWKNKDKSMTRDSQLKCSEPFDCSCCLQRFSKDVRLKSLKGSITKDLKLGDKIAWKLRGSYQLGVIKWKGFVGSKIHAGIEFIKPIRLVMGEDESLDSLFKAKQNHAGLVPWDELIPEGALNVHPHYFINNRQIL